MSILQFRFCPACRGKTYHRYKSCLRSRFTAADHWECVSCKKRRDDQLQRAKRLGLSPDSLPPFPS